jgi:hypothetical protein
VKIGGDEIEVFVSALGAHAQVRVREHLGGGHSQKCSVLLTAGQLREHARECLAIADEIDVPGKTQ